MINFIELIKNIWLDYDYCLKQELLLKLIELIKTLENDKEKDSSTTSKKLKKLIKDLKENKDFENIIYRLRELDIKLQNLHIPEGKDFDVLKNRFADTVHKLQKLIYETSKLSYEQKQQIKKHLERKNDNLLYVAAYCHKHNTKILNSFIETFHKYGLERKNHCYTKEGILHYIIKLDHVDTFREFVHSYFDHKKDISSLIRNHNLYHLIKNTINYSYNIFYYSAEIGSVEIVKHLLSIKSSAQRRNGKDRENDLFPMIIKTADIKAIEEDFKRNEKDNRKLNLQIGNIPDTNPPDIQELLTKASNYNGSKKQLNDATTARAEVEKRDSIIENLVRQDLEKNYPNALDIAIQNGNLEIVKEILCSTHYNDHTTIHTESIYIAACKDFTEILKRILIKQEKINLTSSVNSLVICLIGHSLDKKREISEKIFEEASKEDNTRVIQNIITLHKAGKGGAIVKTKCKYKKQNLLHYAVLKCNLEMVKVLSKRTDLIVDQNLEGNTPLHLCNLLISKSDIQLKKVLKVIEALYKERPEALHMKNRKGISPFMLFASNHITIFSAICRVLKERVANNSNQKQKLYIRLHEVSEQIINTQNFISGRILSLAISFIILSYLITIDITSELQKKNYILGCVAMSFSLIIIAINSYFIEKKRIFNLSKEYNLLIFTLIEEKEGNNSLYQFLENTKNLLEQSSSNLFLSNYRTTNKICSTIKENTNLSHKDKKMYERLSKVSEQLTNTKKIATVSILSLSIAFITLAYLVMERTRKLQKKDYILGCVTMALSLTIITIDSHLIKKNREYNLSEEYKFLINKLIEQKEDTPPPSTIEYSHVKLKVKQVKGLQS